ncbi:helix-turn-helix domain-containing protein [Endozoicomonas sp. SCSIO W0465]|uniref:helix-turn-helix domain-containing protein n=1 Tax=Endozoicomonas sp. SCSIO W0465 TaxID=2918516 RepID=UPI0020752278|nr:helix-turn-helix domain-containing protein [Endozoicomonas sp. SCSIO W0465]USE34588.1 helix-turn-helix domain-containing protein [Endozoicomonas sp. SCSIO W0465]
MQSDNHKDYLDKIWLNTDELFEYLDQQFSKGTLRNWRTQKKGPRHSRIEGKVLYARGDVDQWLNQQVRGAGQ